MVRRLFIIVWCLATVAFATAAGAQLIPPGEGEGAKPAPRDTLGRSTPRGTVRGYLEAIAANDDARAGLYLDAEPGSFRARTLARDLQQVLDRKGRLAAAVEINQQPDGDTFDGLPADIDDIGVLGHGENAVRLQLQRVERDGVPVWLVSSDTLAALPDLRRNSAESLVERYTPDALRNVLFLGSPLGDIAALVVVFIIALLAGWAVAWLLVTLAAALWLRTRGSGDAAGITRVRLPLGVLLSNVWFKAGAAGAGISVIAREFAFRMIDILSTVAVVWLVFVMTSIVGRIALNHMSRRHKSSAISVTKLLTRVVKAIVLIIGIVAILDILGFDVTTGLAALGIGGIALALGAQKTIENLVGSVMLVADQPIRVGDFCQFEGVLGTVEDIGMRSTRVRTLENTLVTIPNGAFSSMQIENWTQRTKYLFRHTFNARYETTATQVRALMAALHAYFAEHENVDGIDPNIRFIALGSHSIDIEVLVYMLADDIPGSFSVQSELLLGVMDIFECEGVDFAFPSQTLYLARDGVAPAVAEP